MSLNKWLCKHMDFGDKGYVTLWDVITGGCTILIIATLTSVFAITSVYAYFHGLALVIQGAMSQGAEVPLDDMACIALFIVITLIGILTVAAIVARKLASIRVATCKRKEED